MGRKRTGWRGSVDLESCILHILPWVQGSDGAGSECNVRFCPFSVTPRKERCLETKAVLLLGARGISHLCITVHGHTGDFDSGCCEGHIASVAFVLALVLAHLFVSIRSVLLA